MEAQQQNGRETSLPADSPTLWIALLERARRTGDCDLAVKAERELHRLGVRVEFGARCPVREGKS